MTDVGDFAEDGFDPIAWINHACSTRQAEEPLEKFLAELEMRLQLSAEDIEATLSDSSAQAMRRIPFAIQEIYRLQGDIQGLQDQVQVMSHTVQRDAGEARNSVQHISQLHRVKANMENACNSLKEATELSGLFLKVEEVFAAGDLPKVAEILANMRHSLSLVGDVPEFRAGRQKLRSLEDRLQQQVEGSLREALARGQEDEAVKQLCGLLLAVDRYGTIESLYVTTKLAQVHALWEEHAGPSPAASSAAAPAGAVAAAEAAAVWLPVFLSRLLALLQAEAGWCGRVLPGRAAALMGALCGEVFGKISKAARERLSSARSLSCLGGLARELGGCGRALGELLREVEAGRRREVLGLLYAPLEDKVAAYGELEAAQLQADMRAALGAGGVEGGGAGGEGDAGAVVSRLAGSIRPAFAALHAAVDRCNALTGGSEVRALLKAADTELSAYLAALQAAVAGLGERHRARVAAAATTTTSAATTTASAAAAAAASAAAAAVDDGEDIANVLQLIKVGRELSAAVSRLEAVLRTAVATAVARLQALTAAPPTPSTSQQQQQQQQQQHGGAAGATPFAAEATAAAASATVSSSVSSSGVAVPHALSGAAEADPVALRLVAARGERLARLVKLGASLSDPRFMVLPGAVAQLEAFSAIVQSTVFGVLLARVSALLAPLPGLPEWTKGGSAGGAHGGVAPLPAFNTYPLPYVTAIGDHLMAVPQQLEVLMGDTDDDAPGSATSATSATGEGAAAAAAAAAGGGGDSAAEWEEVAAEWLDKVVSGAAGMYAEAVCRIPALSHQGGIQLSTDVEYFVNLMTALHVAPPPALLTLQLLAGAAPEEFGELARGALAEGGADAAAVRALAGMRRLPLE